jgi:hypothetical protein
VIEAEADWESDDHVLALPGLPANLTRPADARYVFPSTTLAVVKSLRSSGIPTELAVPRADATFVSHNAADLWLPILQFGSAMLAGAGGNLLSTAIEKLVQRVHDSGRVHLDWRVKSGDGTVQRFRYAGPAREAIQAVREFEASLRRSSGDDDE